jgi:hypothetical protein
MELGQIGQVPGDGALEDCESVPNIFTDAALWRRFPMWALALNKHFADSGRIHRLHEVHVEPGFA